MAASRQALEYRRGHGCRPRRRHQLRLLVFHTRSFTERRHAVRTRGIRPRRCQVGPVRFFAGIRQQFTGQHGETFVSPNAGAAIGVRRFRFRASGYRSFRAPTLNELYRPFRVGNAQTLANAALVPESLTGVEAGFDWSGETTHISFTAFRNELGNLIDNATLSTSPTLILRQRQNFPSALSRGLEASINRQWPHWRAEAGYMYRRCASFHGPAHPASPQAARYRANNIYRQIDADFGRSARFRPDIRRRPEPVPHARLRFGRCLG